MSIIPEDFGESATKFSVIGTDTYGVVVLGHSFGLAVPNVVDGANAIHDSWEACGIQSVLNVLWQLEEVKLTIMTATGPISGTDTRTALAGANGGPGSPPNTAYLVRKVTDTGGRAGRGRMYVPGIEESDINAVGVFEGGIVATATTVFGDMVADFDNNEVPLRLLHNSALVAPSVITGTVFQLKAATQRRRLRR